MSTRRPYVHLAGNLSGWPKGMVPGPAHLRALDQYSSELVNGEDGGTWEPENPIVVGPHVGAGTSTIVINTGSVISGDVETVKGNSLGSELYQTGLIVTGGGAPQFGTPRSRTVVVPFTFFTESDSPQSEIGPLFDVDPVTFGARRALKGTSGSSGAPGDALINVVFPFRAQHRGATITQIDFRFKVAFQRSELPTAYMPGGINNGRMPQFRASRVASGGTVVQPLHNAGGAYDANGWYIDQAATPAAYYNNGQTRTVSYVPNQNNGNLDPSTHHLLLQVADEWYNPSSGIIGNIYLSATVSLTSIPFLRE